MAGISASVLGEEEAKIEQEESEILDQMRLLGERLAAMAAKLDHSAGLTGMK